MAKSSKSGIPDMGQVEIVRYKANWKPFLEREPGQGEKSARIESHNINKTSPKPNLTVN